MANSINAHSRYTWLPTGIRETKMDQSLPLTGGKKDYIKSVGLSTSCATNATKMPLVFVIQATFR